MDNICTECGHERENAAQAETCCTMQGTDCPTCWTENNVADNYDGPDDGDDWSGGFAENH